MKFFACTRRLHGDSLPPKPAAMSRTRTDQMLTASGSAFHDKVAVSQKWNQLNLLVWGALAFAVNGVFFALSTQGLPSWISLLPCTYQVRMVTDEITAPVPVHTAAS